MLTKPIISNGAVERGAISATRKDLSIGTGEKRPLILKGDFEPGPHLQDYAPSRDPELIRRFWEKVTKAGDAECWLWQGATNGNGYGNFRVTPGRRTITASRYAYYLATKHWPGRYLVCHSCDTPL